MATIIITSKDANLFTMQVGVIVVDKTRNYRAQETTGGKIRIENQGNEHSDLINPTLFSEIQIDGVIYNSVNETVSALNSVVYNNSRGSNNTDAECCNGKLGLKELTTEDLDTVKQNGIYLQRKWTRATLTRNYPRKQSGYLMVFVGSNGMGYQTYVTEKNIIYLRKIKADGTFRPWQELIGNNYIFDDEETTAHTPQHYLDNHRLIMRTEFNTVSSLGLTNETGNCALKTFVSKNVGKAVQQAFCFDTGNVYKRHATSSTTWSAWELNGGTSTPTVSQLQTSTNITTSQLIDTHAQNGKHVMMLNGANNLTVTIDSPNGFSATYQKTGAGNITFVAGAGKTLVQVDSTNVINGAVGSSATVSIVGTTIYLRIANA